MYPIIGWVPGIWACGVSKCVLGPGTLRDIDLLARFPRLIRKMVVL